MIYDVVVIGAGQAGLATAHALQDSGLNFCLLEAGDRPAGSWPSYYDSLTLFSPARYSALPGLALDGDPEHYPERNEVIAYLERYARHFTFPIFLNTRVSRVERQGQIFSISTVTGKLWQARSVIVASGAFHQPNRPDFAGMSEFKGKVMHSAEYHSPADIEGQRVAVVGAGNSAVQIAYELAQNHDVTLTSRTPPRFIKQRPWGRDVHFWLKLTGLDNLPAGRWFSSGNTVSVLDQGRYRRAFDSGQIGYKPLFERMSANGLHWRDETLPVDTLILATGFMHRPPYLEGLDGYDAATAARQRSGIAAHIPGLYFVGVPWQRSHASATLRGVGADGRYVVRHLRRYLAKTYTLPNIMVNYC